MKISELLKKGVVVIVATQEDCYSGGLDFGGASRWFERKLATIGYPEGGELFGFEELKAGGIAYYRAEGFPGLYCLGVRVANKLPELHVWGMTWKGVEFEIFPTIDPWRVKRRAEEKVGVGVTYQPGGSIWALPEFAPFDNTPIYVVGPDGRVLGRYETYPNADEVPAGAIVQLRKHHEALVGERLVG